MAILATKNSALMPENIAWRRP